MIREKCGRLFMEAGHVIISACDDLVIAEIRATNDEYVIQKVSNKGKDIGGKLAGLSYYYHFCEPTRYLAFLHDKISPQTLNAEYWFNKLYEIFSAENMDRIEKLFDSKKEIGLVGSKTFLKNEYSRNKKTFDTTNDSILRELLTDLKITPAGFDYIGGTIFIARAAGFSDFFRLHPPLLLREKLEEGNVLDLEVGTYTHSWERLLCFIPQSKGLKVAGI
jgi:hypothetical protein